MIVEILRLFLYLYSVYLIIRFLLFLYNNFIRRRINLTQKYGKDSWVLITGATDGIGKGFVGEFVKEGFNIILVSRNKEKLEKVASEITTVKTHVIEFDFDRRTSIEDYKQTFGDLAEKFDISILVNNVGVNDRNYFENIKIESLKSMINVNVVAQVMLTKIFAPSLSRRSKQSAVIDVSSMSTILPMPWRSMYAATKSFNYFLSRALCEEYKNYNIDFLCLKPFYVESLMTNMKESLLVITAKQCASGTLNDLGYEKETQGHWKHKVQAYILSLVPAQCFYWVLNRKN